MRCRCWRRLCVLGVLRQGRDRRAAPAAAAERHHDAARQEGHGRRRRRSSSASSRKNRSSRSGSSATTAASTTSRPIPICNWSGELGPKDRHGDRQAPEGFYTITREQMNPNSQVPSGVQPRLSQRLRPVAAAHRRVPDGPRQVQVGRLLRHDRRADRGDLRAGARGVHRRPRRASRCTPSRSA